MAAAFGAGTFVVGAGGGVVDVVVDGGDVTATTTGAAVVVVVVGFDSSAEATACPKSGVRALPRLAVFSLRRLSALASCFVDVLVPPPTTPSETAAITSAATATNAIEPTRRTDIRMKRRNVYAAPIFFEQTGHWPQPECTCSFCANDFCVS